MLPFLSMYAAFGQVSDSAYRLLTQQSVRYGFLSDQVTVIGALNTLATEHRPEAGRPGGRVSICSGGSSIYLHERTGWRVLGLGVVLIESFFLLVLILGGIRVFQTFGTVAARAGPSPSGWS